MIETYKNLHLINSPVTIQDIVLTGYYAGEAGEFANKTADVATQKNRLYKHIEFLAKRAAAEHLKINFDKNLSMQKEKRNAITRLVTNEFAFYTRKPLSIEDFSELQQWINTLAKKLPKNLHLVLSSFAVKTPDNKVMNVVAEVECGVEPKLSLIVKNTFSATDPVYSEIINGRKVTLPYITQENNQVDSYKITVNGKSVPFSFKNVIECETAGGAKFHLCVEICLDHFFSVAKKQLESTLKISDNASPKKIVPSQCSHVVTSNTIKLYSKYSLGNVTHADPVFWRQGVKKGAHVLQENRIKSSFGSDLKVFITSPTICSKLPAYEQSLVDAYNNEVLNTMKPVTVRTVPIEMTKNESCIKQKNFLPTHNQLDNNTALPSLIAALRGVIVSTTSKLPEKSLSAYPMIKDAAASDRRNRRLL